MEYLCNWHSPYLKAGWAAFGDNIQVKINSSKDYSKIPGYCSKFYGNLWFLWNLVYIFSQILVLQGFYEYKKSKGIFLVYTIYISCIYRYHPKPRQKVYTMYIPSWHLSRSSPILMSVSRSSFSFHSNPNISITSFISLYYAKKCWDRVVLDTFIQKDEEIQVFHFETGWLETWWSWQQYHNW